MNEIITKKQKTSVAAGRDTDLSLATFIPWLQHACQTISSVRHESRTPHPSTSSGSGEPNPPPQDGHVMFALACGDGAQPHASKTLP